LGKLKEQPVQTAPSDINSLDLSEKDKKTLLRILFHTISVSYQMGVNVAVDILEGIKIE
jgi:hypothetical protein